ncbi:MAG: TIGR00730 family Rossman fold protein [Bacteroidales bacterium]|nr:TIGR00730 family Rossman fold protein [Bacteroidales bacterium]
MACERKIVFYCSASRDIDQKFNQAAREAARAACALGYTIVSGGTVKGTMGELADEVAKCGGRHVGIIPRFMSGVVFPDMTRTIWTDSMAQRKELMREGTCAAVALPGGIGTLDELIETLTLAKLGLYPGRIFALNLDGFYDPLKALLDHYVATGMLDRSSRDLISFPETVSALEDALK